MADFGSINFRAFLDDTIPTALRQAQLASSPEGGTPMTSRAKMGSTGYPSALGLTDVFLNFGLTTSTAVAQENFTATLMPLLQTTTAKAAGSSDTDIKTFYGDIWARYTPPDVLKSLEDLTDEQFKKIFKVDEKLPNNDKDGKDGSTSEQPGQAGSGSGGTGSTGASTNPILTGNTGQYPVSSPFGMRSRGMHYGIDIGCPTGTPVIAPIAGNVVDAGVCNQGLNAGFGIFVVLHVLVEGADYVLIYGHLQSVSVSAGQDVVAGQLLGYSNNTGGSEGPHLHFEMRKGTTEGSSSSAIDPAPYLSSGWQVIGAVP